MKLLACKKIAIFTLIIMIFPWTVWADPEHDYIISDEELADYNSMDRKDIQEFLESKASYLAGYSYMGNNPSPDQLALDPDKKYYKTRTAAEIIYNAAQESKINPKFLLTMMQKEMGLVEDGSPTENQLAYAMGYNCPDSGGCDFRTKGFGKQVRASAQQFRWFVDHIYEYNWQPGRAACADDPNPFLPCTAKGTVVTPTNAITAAMYLYTPHIHGNQLFASLWDKYGFGTGTVVVPPPVTTSGFFPDGALVKAKDSEDGTVYLIEDGDKRPFANMTALVSRYEPGKVLLVDSEELANYPQGDPIAHANYSILGSSAGNRYLIDGLTKRLIPSDDVFRELGFNPQEVEQVSDEELSYYEDGDQLTAEASPYAEVWLDLSSKYLYLIKDGQKHLIIDEEIYTLNYPEMAISQVTSDALADLASGSPVKLIDGTLVKKDLDKDVYVISNGYKRLIPDGTTFEKLGYSWGNIYTISDKVFNLHKLGEPLISQE